MTDERASRERDPELGEDLIGSDIRYFELGARIEAVGRARIAWLPGFADVPAGCVVVNANDWASGSWTGSALDALERRAAELGSRVRLYLGDSAPGLESAMLARGYRCRRETGHVVSGALPAPRVVALEPVEDAHAWERKRALHRRAPDIPDGHALPPDRHVELERAKWRTGELKVWLVTDRHEVAGTVCTLESGRILRLKNLLVARERRRRGIGTATLSACSELARRSGRVLGLFAVDGAPGVELYDRPQVVPVTRWVEWLAPPFDADEGDRDGNG